MSSVSLVRAAVWLGALVIAFFAPLSLEPIFRRVERTIAAFAARRMFCCLGLGLLVLLGRLAMLPLREIPKPYVPDEFCYLLQADTFSSLRLTNAPHPMGDFFENPFLLQRPTYNAKFPPGQGMMLAAGQLLTGNPWFGVWLSCGLLAATLCWALHGWFQPSWALFGSALTLPLCLTSYWMDSYWGGAVAAIGGSLVVGAVPRILGRNGLEHRHRASAILAFGAVLIACTRPFEGLLVLLPLFIYLLLRRPPLRVWIPAAAVFAIGMGWLGYYNYRVTGNPARLPYLEYDSQYPSTSHFNILPLPPPVKFRTENLTWNDAWERRNWALARGPQWVAFRSNRWMGILNSFFGSAVLVFPLLLFWRQLIPNRRLRPLWWALLLSFAGSWVEVIYIEHYAAPLLAVLLILVVHSFRHLRRWKFQGHPTGLALTRTLLAAMMLLWLGREGLHLVRRQPVGETPDNSHKSEIEAALEEKGPAHVVLVRYNYRALQTEKPMDIHSDWSYNRADIDSAPVIWAHDLGPEENRRLLQYFKGRAFWLFRPDDLPGHLEPYQPGP